MNRQTTRAPTTAAPEGPAGVAEPDPISACCVGSGKSGAGTDGAFDGLWECAAAPPCADEGPCFHAPSRRVAALQGEAASFARHHAPGERESPRPACVPWGAWTEDSLAARETAPTTSETAPANVVVSDAPAGATASGSETLGTASADGCEDPSPLDSAGTTLRNGSTGAWDGCNTDNSARGRRKQLSERKHPRERPGSNRGRRRRTGNRGRSHRCRSTSDDELRERGRRDRAGRQRARRIG